MEHTEIPHNDLRHDFVDEARPLLNELIDMIHDDNILTAGERLTIAVSFDCGFSGRIIFEVDADGTHE